MLNKFLKGSTHLTNKDSWHFEVVVHNTEYVGSLGEVNTVADLLSDSSFKHTKFADSLLAFKQYPFNQAARKVKGSLQSFSRPPKP